MNLQQESQHGREKDSTRTSNEYVLSVASISFLFFVVVQAVFALIANSESMLADSEAMAVDGLTYLFNLCAERVKKAPLSDEELKWTPNVRVYRRELRRLYLELVPPSISVMTLIVVTVMTLNEAFATLFGHSDGQEVNVSVPIMLLFSSGNLILDIINVICFARAQSTFGFDVVRRENNTLRDSWRSIDVTNLHEEASPLNENNIESTPRVPYGSFEGIFDSDNHTLVNLNMCSAWTHVCADTLRSIAVLVAAALATLIPSIDGTVADAVAAVAVSFIILVSLVPLIQGLVVTALQISYLYQHPVTD